MITKRAPANKLLVGSSALLLVLFLLPPPAGAADNVAKQEVVPTVTITAGATTHNEPDGPMSFTLHASPAPAADLDVKLDSRQTGVVFAEAIERSFTETIPAGEESHSFDFVVVNDLVVEPEGIVTITVADSEVHYEVGAPSEAVTTLVDDDVPITVSWDSSTVHVNEDAGTVTVPFFIRVHNGRPPGTFKSADEVHEGVAFVLTTASVTADATTDFVYQSYFYIWDVGSFTVDASGDYTLSDQIEIEIIDDSDDEPGETFELYFESPLPAPLDVGDTVIPTDRKTIVIADDDGVNNAPEFTATAEQVSVSEDIEAGTLIGVSFEATDFDGHEVTFGVVGDSLPFEIDVETDTLKVSGALDFETQAEYTFAVAASDGVGGSSETSVAVTVTNVDEPGVVELAPMAPEEGAMVEATLSDVDGPTDDMTWEWSQSEAPDGEFDPIDGQTDDHYMPTPDDVGMYLRATATYTDGEGADKSADATTSEPVAARQGEGGDPTITVLWSENPFHVNEGDGTVELPITVRVDDNRPPGTYTAGGVEYEGSPFSVSTRADTAMSPGDYQALSAEVLLPVGSFELQASGSYEASGVVSATIVDDEDIEATEMLNMVAEYAPGVVGVTLPSDDLSIVIADNDGDPPDPQRPPWPPPDFCPTHPDSEADMSTPLSVAVGGSVSDDFCSKDDADWVAVDLVAGTAYRIEGTFTSTDGNRPIYIAGMYEPDGELITGSHSFDGNPYGTSNTSGYINFRPTQTGTHYVGVGDMGWYYFRFATGPLSWEIDVHEADLPPDDVPGVTELTLEFNNYGYFVDEFEGKTDTHGDRDTFAIDVEAGHRYFVEMRNRNDSGIFNCIHGIASAETPDQPGANSRECWHRAGWKASRWIIPDADGRKLITVGSDNGTGDYLLRVRDYSAVPPGVWDTPLPDGDLAQDTSTTGLVYVNDSWVNSTAVRGEIDLAGDKDWIRVELEGGRRYQIDIRGEGSGVGTLRDSYMWLHDGDGRRIQFADDGGDSYPEARLVMVAPTTGTYFIQVAGSHHEIGTYDLSVLDMADLYTMYRPS